MVDRKKYFHAAATVSAVLLLWQLLTQHPESFLPTPVTVLQTFIAQVQQPRVLEAAFRTTYRVYISAVIALVLGVIIGTAEYFSETVSDVIDTLFYPSQFVSEAVLTLLAVAMIGLSPLIIYIITVLAILPDIFVVVRVGLQELDEGLMEFGEVHADSRGAVYSYLVLPQVLPYIFSGFLRAHATAWDIVATVEIFLIAGGLGQLTQTHYQMLDLPKLFATVVLILALGLASDRALRLVKQRIDRRYKHGDDQDNRPQ
jgi:NitT/TauT family transport system permease protein